MNHAQCGDDDPMDDFRGIRNRIGRMTFLYIINQAARISAKVGIIFKITGIPEAIPGKKYVARNIFIMNRIV